MVGSISLHNNTGVNSFKNIKTEDKEDRSLCEDCLDRSEPEGDNDLRRIKDVKREIASGTKPVNNEGSIVGGLIAEGIGAGLIAAASVGCPVIGVQLATGTLLNTATRLVGFLALQSGAGAVAQGEDNRVLRGALTAASGIGQVALGVGAFGPVGGLTAVGLVICGGLATLGGVAQMTTRPSQN